MPSFKSAWDYFHDENGSRDFQSTGDDNVDLVIGVAFGTLTEISGEAGCGKSQLCMQLAASALTAGRRVLYIDTEKGFSMKRIGQLCQYLSGTMTSTKNLICSTPPTVQALMILLEQCALKEMSPDVLILDSITLYFRGEDLKEMSYDLDNVAVALCRLATEMRKAVICTNHVTTKFDDDGSSYLNPSLGNYWSHRPTNRIWMLREGSKRYIELVKSPFAKQRKAEFQIKDEGLQIVNPEVLRF